MSNDNKPTDADVIYDHDDQPEINKRAAFAQWLKSRKGKVSLIAASGLVLVGATAAAGVVGSNLAHQQEFGGSFSEDHKGPGAFENDHPLPPESMPDGYGPGADDFGAGGHHGPDGDRDGDFGGHRPPHGPGGERDQFTPLQAPTDAATSGTKS